MKSLPLPERPLPEKLPPPAILTTVQLAERWGLSKKTLQNWRSLKEWRGPMYFHVGRLVRYKLEDVENWEARNRAVIRKTGAD